MSDGQAPITFADGKDAEALRTIGEVAQALDIRQHVLRYWEEQFPMLRPIKRSGGRRYYRPEDVKLVAAIYRLVHREGYTLRGARLALEGKKAAPDAPPLPLEPVSAMAGASDGLVQELRALRTKLADALADS